MPKLSQKKVLLCLLLILALGIVLLMLVLQQIAGPTIAAALTAGIATISGIVSYVRGPTPERSLQAWVRRMLRSPRALAICATITWVTLISSGVAWWLLQPEKIYRMVVTVQDEGGQPVEGLKIQFAESVEGAASTDASGHASFTIRLSELKKSSAILWKLKSGTGNLLISREIVLSGSTIIRIPHQPPPFRVRYLTFKGADALRLADMKAPQRLDDNYDGRIIVPQTAPLRELIHLCEDFHPGFREQDPGAPRLSPYDVKVTETTADQSRVRQNIGSDAIPRCFFPFYTRLFENKVDIFSDLLREELSAPSAGNWNDVLPAKCNGDNDPSHSHEAFAFVGSANLARVRRYLRNTTAGAQDDALVKRVPFDRLQLGAIEKFFTEMVARGWTQNLAMLRVSTVYDECAGGETRAELIMRTPVVEAVLIEPLENTGYINWATLRTTQNGPFARHEDAVTKELNLSPQNKVTLLPDGYLQRDEALLVVTRVSLEWPDGCFPTSGMINQCAARWAASKNSRNQLFGSAGAPPAARLFTPSKALRSPQYIGAQSQLDTLSWDGIQYSVRQAPPRTYGNEPPSIQSGFSQLVSSYLGYENRSCPFVFLIDDQGGQTYLGEIIPGASGRERTRKAFLKIPRSSSKIMITEEQPERAFLDEVYLRVSQGDGKYYRIDFAEPKLRSADGRYQIIERGEAMTLTIPEFARSYRQIELVSVGYYDRLGAIN